MATTKEKWQEIANRGLQDRFDPQTRAKFDEAVRRGLIQVQKSGQGGFVDDVLRPAAEFIAPVVEPFSEFAAAANRGALKLAESLTIDPLNASAQLLGIEGRIPKPTESSELVKAFTEGGFLEPGLATTAIRAAGELTGPGAAIGGMTRSIAKGLAPAVTAAPSISKGVIGSQAAPTAQTMGQGFAQQLSKGSAKLDVGLSAVSGAGSELGRESGGETGALVGSFLAPISAAGITGVVKSTAPRVLDAGKRGFQALAGSVSGMSDDGASKLMGEWLIREGISPEEALKKLADLGPEAIPADAANSFARLLRVAANKVPRLEGNAGQILKARQAGQGNRIATAFDDATGTASLTADDEIVRLNKVLGPQIDEAYAAARSKAGQLFTGPKVAKGLSFAEKPKKTRLENILDDKFVAGSKIKNKVDLELNAKAASGETVTPLDKVDATKRALDDEIQTAIRKGADNKARSLVILKNSLLKEADAAIPEYKQARNLFAGKAALENATDQGSLFLNTKLRDMQAITKSFGDSEKRFYKLGAKRAIMDKIDDSKTNADLVKKMFDKNGDVEKLKFLFDDDAAFKRFSDTLKQEAEFVLTRRAAQANSMTVKQGLDELNAESTLNNALDSVSSPVGAARVFGRIVGGLSQKRGSAENVAALEEVGDILLKKGFNPDNLRRMLEKGTAKSIEARFRRAIKKDLEGPRIGTPVSTGVATEAINEGAK